MSKGNSGGDEGNAATAMVNAQGSTASMNVAWSSLSEAEQDALLSGDGSSSDGSIIVLVADAGLDDGDKK